MTSSFEKLLHQKDKSIQSFVLANNAPIQIQEVNEAWQSKNFSKLCYTLSTLKNHFEEDAYFWLIYGRSLTELKNYEEALSCLDKSIKIDAGKADTHHFKGVVYQHLAQFHESKESYLSALSLQAERPLTLSNLSCIEEALGNFQCGMAYAKRAIELNQTDTSLIHNYGIMLAKNGQIQESLDCFEKNTVQREPFPPSLSALLYHQLFISDGYESQMAESAKQLVAETFSRGHLCETQFVPNKDKIKIGYISSDFRRHSCAFFIEPILRKHSADFEVHVFHNNPVSDAYTEHLQSFAHKWFDVFSFSDDELKELILKQELDVIVDLNGHTGGNRIAVLGQRVAAIQINYLGYPQKTWLPEMDYRLVDKHTDPANFASANGEKLLRMPSTFLAYEPLIGSPDIMPPPMLQSDQIVFGSFNNPMKIGKETVSVWSELMRAVPNSIIKLKSHCLRSENQRSRITQLFTQEKISVDRVCFLNPVDDDTEHLEAYNFIDIALDTFPYNGTTTTLEALLMGTPVLSLSGKSHRSRVTYSILKNLGLPEFAPEKREDFVNQGLLLTKSPQYLGALSASLRYLLSKSPLSQHEVFVQNYETLLKQVIEQHLSSGQS